MNATVRHAPVWSGAAVARGSGASVRTIVAVAAAALIAAAGFLAARSLGRAPTPPAEVCSETCAPARTVDKPTTKHNGLAQPASSKHKRSLQ